MKQILPRLLGLLGVAVLAAGLTVACSAPKKDNFSVKVEGGAPNDDWPARPEVQGRVEAHFPVVQRQSVQVGGADALDVRLVERRDQPVVVLRWLIPGGRAAEWQSGAAAPVAKKSVKGQTVGGRWPEGTAQLTGDLLTMGTKHHPGQAYAAALGELGAHLDVQVLSDATVVSGRVMAHKVAPFLALLHEMLTEPSLEASALDNLKKRYRSELHSEAGDAAAVAHRLGLRLAYGADHPYGSTGATLDSIDKIQLQHVRAAWQQLAQLGGSTLVVVGDTDLARLIPQLQGPFAAELALRRSFAAVALPQAITGDTCWVTDLPEAQQTALVQVSASPSRRAKIWPVLSVANQILGGSASSRLFADLRGKRGLTYGIYSSFDGRRDAGRWAVNSQVRSDAVGEALLAIDEHVLRARREAPQTAELADATRYLAGQFGLALAGPDQVAEFVTAEAMYGLDRDVWKNYAETLQNVTGDQVVEATVSAIAAGGRASVLVGPLAQLRPGIDAACRRIVQQTAQGQVQAVLLGADAEMGDHGRAEAFAAWAKAPPGLVAAGRYASELQRNLAFRALALAAAARGPAFAQVPTAARAIADWKTALAPALVAELRKNLADPDVKVQHHAHAVLLALATTRTDGDHDLNSEQSTQVLTAVAQWAFAGVEAGKSADEIRTLAESRLDPGDVAYLGAAAPEALEQWIAAGVRHLEAAHALQSAGTPEALRALVRGYRYLLLHGGVPVQQDLDILGNLAGIDALVLLLDMHASVERSDEPARKATAVAVMKTLRQLTETLATGNPSPLREQFGKVEAHFENLLAMRNADDRWFAAEYLITYRGVAGLRRVLSDLVADDHYRQPAFRNLEPKQAMALLAREFIGPLGNDAESALLAGLAGRNPMGKVLAVAGLKALGTHGARSALQTCTDETEVASLVELSPPVTVRDLAVAAADVLKFMTEVDALVTQGQLTPESAKRYKAIAYFTYDLTDRRLRAEVQRQAAAPAVAPGQAATATDSLP